MGGEDGVGETDEGDEQTAGARNHSARKCKEDEEKEGERKGEREGGRVGLC